MNNDPSVKSTSLLSPEPSQMEAALIENNKDATQTALGLQINELTQKVTDLGQMLEHLLQNQLRQYGTKSHGSSGLTSDGSKQAKAPFPPAHHVRTVIRNRRLRARHFQADLFADPAWDMLLDLAVATSEKHQVSVSSLCLAADVPPTTALRWIGVLAEAGYVERSEDVVDRRRIYVTLTEAAIHAIAEYFNDLEKDAPITV